MVAPGPARTTGEAEAGRAGGHRLPPDRVLRDTEPGHDPVQGGRGTHNFHTYATACLVGGPDRYTVGVTAVGEKEPMTDVLTRLLDQLTAARVTVRVALLDKAFFTIAVMRLLQSHNVPFVIPAVVLGRKPRPGVPAVGLRALRRRRAGRYTYTHADRGTSVRSGLVIAHKSDRHRKTGGRRTKTLLYAPWRVTGAPVPIRDLYRRRFGIESSYRRLGQVRPRTSTTNGVVRLLWVAVGLILRNAWIRFRTARGPGWALTTVCLILLADSLASPTIIRQLLTDVANGSNPRPPT
ncbi:transposase [Gemmata obscuriglobus]|uniref:transposase n=1 Tax=Gemmata obscuriglobus TaxID=114 RepID=UPI0008FB5095|nr:transposase [Gemmata obscuriglobus]